MCLAHFFGQDYLLNLIILGVYAKRWPKCARISRQKLMQHKIWSIMIFLILAVRRLFHRKDFKRKKMGVRRYFLKKRKLYMQNLTKERKQPQVLILQKSIFYNIFLVAASVFYGCGSILLLRKRCALQFCRTFLTLSWRRSLSYRNQSIDLLCKSMDWFLYDNDLRHKIVKLASSKAVSRWHWKNNKHRHGLVLSNFVIINSVLTFDRITVCREKRFKNHL